MTNTTEEILILFIRKVLFKAQVAVKHDADSNEKMNYLSDLLTRNFKSKITICVVDNENFIKETECLKDNIKLFTNYHCL